MRGLIPLVAVGVLLTVTFDLALKWSSLSTRDYAVLWTAGRLALTGHAASAYDPAQLFAYPPIALLLFAPLAAFPLAASFVIWQLFSASLFYVAARPYLPAGFRAPVVLLTPASLVSIYYGQTGLFYGALWLFAFRGGWAAFGLLAMKPHLGLLSGIEAWRRKQVVQAAATVAVLVIVSIALFGLEPWRAWIVQAAPRQSALLEGSKIVWYRMMTEPALGYGLFGWAMFACAAGCLLTRRFDVFTAATAAFLIAPYGFHYDMTVVCLGFAVLLCKEDLPPGPRAIAALAYLAPALVYFGTWLAPPILLLGLWIQTVVPQTRTLVAENEASPEAVAGAPLA